jgi:hypothetical protein
VNVIARFDRRTGPHRLECPQSVAVAAFRVIRTGLVASGVSSGEGSFAGPYNNQMEPSRPMVCAMMTPRRAAHLAR